MIGIILILASWLLLHMQNRSLVELGFNRPRQRTIEFIAGFLLAAVFVTAQMMLITYFSGFGWEINPDVTLSMVLESLRWNINSVLYEELVFRGYLLYKAIEWVGVRKACIISAIVFGIYHWFSYGILGAAMPMLFVFITTGSFGLAMAYCFAKSKSVVLPIALHLGWNVVNIFVFSNGPIGAQLLIPDNSEKAMLTVMQQFTVNLFIPLGFVVLVLWLVTKKVPQYNQETG